MLSALKRKKQSAAKTGPPLASYAKAAGPPAPAKGPGATPKAGQLVREGINYKDVDPGLQAQMAKQAGLVPSSQQLPPGVVTPQQQSATAQANEEFGENPAEESKETSAQEDAEESAETKAKADLEVPKGHTAVAAHTRKLPISKVGRAKLKARGVTPSDE